MFSQAISFNFRFCEYSFSIAVRSMIFFIAIINYIRRFIEYKPSFIIQSLWKNFHRPSAAHIFNHVIIETAIDSIEPIDITVNSPAVGAVVNI